MAHLYASPNGGPVTIDGQSVQSRPLPDAIAQARGGDRVIVTPGTYTSPITVTTGGSIDSPLIIQGMPGAVCDGKIIPKPFSHRPKTPDPSSFSFIKIVGADHVLLEGLAFRNSWPVSIGVFGGKHIHIRQCSGEGSTYFVFAGNHWQQDKPQIGHDLHVEDCVWTQDPEEKMWKGEISWKSVKGQKSPPHHQYLQGAMVGGADFGGDVRVVRCTARHAFNGVRLECEDDPNLTRNRNVNVEVADCRFEYIRDNAIEPEISAQNWWVYRNEFFNVHAAHSLHGFSGGPVYIFGNRHWFNSKPGDTSNTGGKMLKFHEEKPYPSKPIWVFHNSYHSRSTYTKDGITRQLKHYNNAIEFCFSGPYCAPDRHPFADDNTHFAWHSTYDFKGDICNHISFPDKFDPAWNYIGHFDKCGCLAASGPMLNLVCR